MAYKCTIRFHRGLSVPKPAEYIWHIHIIPLMHRARVSGGDSVAHPYTPILTQGRNLPAAGRFTATLRIRYPCSRSARSLPGSSDQNSCADHINIIPSSTGFLQAVHTLSKASLSECLQSAMFLPKQVYSSSTSLAASSDRNIYDQYKKAYRSHRKYLYMVRSKFRRKFAFSPEFLSVAWNIQRAYHLCRFGAEVNGVTEYCKLSLRRLS